MRALLILLCTLLVAQAQKLPPEKAAALDGAYSAINQKGITHLQQLVAQGKGDKSTPADIQYYTNAISQAKARWANTPYKANFDQAYQKEMANAGTRPVTTPPQPIPSPTPYPAQPPFTLSFPAKAVIFFAGIWGGRKLWKAQPKAVQQIALDQYAPVSLSPEDERQIEAAGLRRGQRLAKIEGETQVLNRQLEGLRSNAAAVAAVAFAQSNAVLKTAAAALAAGKPEYDALIAAMESRAPISMAPWSSPAWQDFERTPRPEMPREICVAHIAEKALPGEDAVRAPWMASLLAAKGAIIVRSDAASKERGRTVIHNLIVRAALGAPAEIQFSLLDPFGMGAGFPMRKLLPRVRPSASSPAEEIEAVMNDIRRINESVVIQADSFGELTREQRAGELFEIVVVLDYPTEYQRDPRMLDYLARIGQAGPRAGRFLILEWNGSPAVAELARFQNAQIIDVAAAPAECQFDPVAPADQRQRLLSAAGKIKSESTGGDWDSQVRPARFFAESSERLIATTVGERLTFWFGENQDRKQCAHGVMAGQSGSGKSSLLHVLITGLCARYSPDELQLMLVDGKQGVELDHYRELPHAQVVCLLTPPAVARSVLQDLVEEMRDRNEKFKEAGVQKLEEYRRTGRKMARMLMVVDEYQQLLAGDSDRGSQLLTEVLEKGRAAGIHILLASQMFEASGLRSSAMANVHLRASLVLAGDYLNGVTAFGSQGKKLIRELSPGQVVINDESGRDGANSKGAVARLDNPAGSSLKQIIAEITAAAGGPGSAVVLSGTTAGLLAENPFVRNWAPAPPDPVTLQTVAQKKVRDGGFGAREWSVAEKPVPFWLGRKFDVRGHALAILKRGPAQNLLALGSKTGVRLAMLANGLAALRSMHAAPDCEVLFLDGLGAGRAGDGLLAAGLEVLREAGARVRRATSETAAAELETFAASRPASPGESLRLLIVSEPENLPALAASTAIGAQPTGAARIFKEVLRNGPGEGLHTILTASGWTALQTVIGERDLGMFNHRVAQQTNDNESVKLFDRPIAAQINLATDHPMAALYVDVVQGVKEAQLFKGYAAGPNVQGDQTAADLANTLRAVFGARQQGAGTR